MFNLIQSFRSAYHSQRQQNYRYDPATRMPVATGRPSVVHAAWDAFRIALKYWRNHRASIRYQRDQAHKIDQVARQHGYAGFDEAHNDFVTGKSAQQDPELAAMGVTWLAHARDPAAHKRHGEGLAKEIQASVMSEPTAHEVTRRLDWPEGAAKAIEAGRLPSEVRVQYFDDDSSVSSQRTCPLNWPKPDDMAKPARPTSDQDPGPNPADTSSGS
jgi:hypothetical protein